MVNLVRKFGNLLQWWRRTPERAIAEAYQAAVRIKKIEDEFFNGQPISDTAGYRPNTYNLFRVQLRRNLQIIWVRLAEYRLSAPLPFTTSDADLSKGEHPLLDPDHDQPSLVQQLAFIDYIWDRYQVKPSSSRPVTPQPVQLLDVSFTENEDNPDRFTLFSPSPRERPRPEPPPITPVEKTIIPGSFFRAFDRIRRTITGAYFGYERDLVDELRQVRRRDRLAVRFLILLMLAVVGTQILTKNLIFSPLFDHFFPPSTTQVNFSPALQERAFDEYRLARDRWEFQRMVTGEDTDPEEMRSELQRILLTYNRQSNEGIKNLGADLTTTLVFYVIILNSRRQLSIVKEFLDEVLFSLNDTAKAFLIIVATDTFVGFHSSDGWDALLFVIFQHFGIAENPVLTKTFIATVPVFLDGLFKFWIFQYLRQSSPSTATIFSEMNQ